MTLGGIAAAIGLLIDDAIVMIEHIARRAGVPGLTEARERRAAGGAEFSAPLFGSSLATIIIFAAARRSCPGVTGAFFKFLSLTMASALIISFAADGASSCRCSRAASSIFATWHDPAHGRETWLRRAARQSCCARLFARPCLDCRSASCC